MAALSEEAILEQFKCPICLEIFHDPVIIPCGNIHMCCEKCLGPILQDEDPRCTLCRLEIDRSKIQPATDIQNEMKKNFSCPGCKQKIMLQFMQRHLESCPKIDRTVKKFKPVVETAYIPSDVPNRSTFECPFCHLKHLDNQGLLEHCNEQHSANTASVVCPVCAAMPWGSKTQRSSNFIQHLNLRHQFEYDTYVEYGRDEESMIQAAIQASLQGE